MLATLASKRALCHALVAVLGREAKRQSLSSVRKATPAKSISFVKVAVSPASIGAAFFNALEPIATTPAGVLHVTVTVPADPVVGVTAPPLRGIVTAMAVKLLVMPQAGSKLVVTVLCVDDGVVANVTVCAATKLGAVKPIKPILANNRCFIAIPFWKMRGLKDVSVVE